MNKSIKIVSIVGARPNFVKLAPMHKKLSNICDHTIIHTGQHYDFELSEIFFKDFDLPKPDYNLEIGPGTQCYQIGEMIKKIENLFLSNEYDMVIVYGDTNSTFAGAFAASKSNIKVAHIESGLRSFDRRMPEETNRILTDNLSDLLFASTETAVRNLLNENIFGKIIRTGDLSVEIINQSLKMISKSKIIEILGLHPKNYLLFTMHRAENTLHKESFLSIINVFEKLKDTIIVFPIHPRTKKILEDLNLLEKITQKENVKLIQPVGYLDFIRLMHNANKIITDSGGVQKEAYLLSVPCITIRKNTEWMETVKEGWNVLVGTDPEQIIKYANDWQPSAPRKDVLGNGNTSTIITEEILKEIEKSDQKKGLFRLY